MVSKMKTYVVNGKTYTEDEIIAIHRFWQDIQDRISIEEGIELALAMIGDDAISERIHENKSDVVERCLQAFIDFGVWQDECLSQNCLLLDYLIADKIKELYANQKEVQL